MNEPIIAAASVEIDGSAYDAETGEFLYFVEKPFSWEVKDRESAEWVLGKMLTAEAALVSVSQSPEVLRAKAVLANAERLTKEHQARLDSLRRRFDDELGNYARKELEGGKSRTLKTVLGCISLRTKSGGVRLLNEDNAIEWAKAHCPDAVKVKESFQISQLDARAKDRIRLVQGWLTAPQADRDVMSHEDNQLLCAFRVEPDSETVQIKTGVTNV